MFNIVSFNGAVVESIKSQDNKHKLVCNAFGAGSGSILVRYYAKDFDVMEGDTLQICGKSQMINGSLLIEAESITKLPEGFPQSNFIAVGGRINVRPRNNPKAPIKVGIANSNYDYQKRENVTSWFNANIWGVKDGSKQEQLLSKGNTIGITGSIERSVYNEKEQYNINARRFDLLASKKAEPSYEYDAANDGATPPESKASDNWDSVPF